jgi:hypothetical protein
MGARNLSDKNAVRAAMDQMQAVKKATNLIITMYLTIQHPLLRPETSDSGTRNCPTLDEAIAAAKSFEGLVDIFQFRPAAAMGVHPTGRGHKVTFFTSPWGRSSTMTPRGTFSRVGKG